MAKFLSELELRKAHDKDDGWWKVTVPLVFESDVAGAVIEVPVGFETDLASVPRLPVVYLAAGGAVSEAPVVHDYLYATGKFPRNICDKVFLEAMEVTGVPAWRRYAMYWAVRAFGWQFYQTGVDRG